MLTHTHTVLFDLDGTLVDSVPDLAWCINAALADVGGPCRTQEEIAHWVGNGMQRLIERAIAGCFDAPAEPSIYVDVLSRFQYHYGCRYCRDSTLYPTVTETLSALHSAGIKLGCVTNKPEAFTHRILESFQLDTYFGVVVGGDTLEQRKPHPSTIHYAIEHLACSGIRGVVLVGDSETDIATARAVCIPVVAVSYGYNHGRDIAISMPDVVINQLRELLPLIVPSKTI